MLGTRGDSLSGETGVSSNSVTGVSGTGACCCCCCFRDRWSDMMLPLWLSRLEVMDEGFDWRLSRPVGISSEKKLAWLGRGVLRSGRTCVQPSRKMSQSSQQAWMAEPSSSSSGALPSRLFCRRLKSISARDQHALSREFVSSATSVRCFISRWQRVM